MARPHPEAGNEATERLVGILADMLRSAITWEEGNGSPSVAGHGKKQTAFRNGLTGTGPGVDWTQSDGELNDNRA